MESLFAGGMGDLHPSRADAQFGRRASAGRNQEYGGGQKTWGDAEERGKWEGNAQRRTGPMQEDVVAKGNSMRDFVQQRVKEMPPPNMGPDPTRSQFHVDKKHGRRASGEGDKFVDPRYAEAVKKERLAMQAVMDQRRKMAEFYEQNMPVGRESSRNGRASGGASRMGGDEGPLLPAGMRADQRGNKTVDPISGESFYSETANGRGRAISNPLIHDVMYNKQATKPPADPKSSHPAVKSTRPW